MKKNSTTFGLVERICRWRGLAITAPIVALGCASAAPPPAMSGAVSELKGVSCPEGRIRVLETREVEDDTVYVLDACGTRMEIARGLVVPTRRSEVSETSSENPPSRPSGMDPDVAHGKVAIVRREVQRWCVLDRGEPRDPDVVAFYGKTPEEVSACQHKLAEMLKPLGTERDPDTGEESYSFTLGQYVFTVKEALYDARATSGGATKRVAVPPPGGADGEWAQRDRNERIWFGHIELGTGFISNEAPGSSYGSISWQTQTAIGLKLGSDLGLGLIVGTHMGITEPADAKRPFILENGLGIVYYPGDSGLHLDANASLALFSYGFEQNFEPGPLFGAGIGYHAGARKKKAKEDNSWTGFGIDLRGMYTFADRHETFAVGLFGGMHVW